jgi:hypothetical protein
MTPRARRALFTVVLFFAVCAVVGSVLQRRVGAQSATDESQLRDSLKSFTDVYSLVEKNYAEPIDGDKADTAIYDGAIPGMLRVLDALPISVVAVSFSAFSTRTPIFTIPRPTPGCAKISAAIITVSAWLSSSRAIKCM